jgi:molecular chaperone DnaJ
VTAALGGDFTVPTLDGSDAKVRVPEGTQSGKQFRLRGKGMTVLRSRDLGELYIQVVIETPQNLTRRQRELLQEFERESSGETHPESSGFFTRVRDFFDGIGGAGRA